MSQRSVPVEIVSRVPPTRHIIDAKRVAQPEEVKLVVREGIEFYVTHDGQETGLSVAGLARLCGISKGTMSELLTKVNQLANNRLPAVVLEGYQGQVYYPGVVGVPNNARIVTAAAAASVVIYYANYSTKVDPRTAKLSLQKFAAKGMANWIKEVVREGTLEAKALNDNPLNLSFNAKEILAEIMVPAKKYANVQNVANNLMPGLKRLLEALEVDDALVGSERLTTIPEWLRGKHMELERPQKHRLALMASQTYRSLLHADPPVVYRKTNGKYPVKLNGYRMDEFSILETALEKVLKEENKYAHN